VLERLAETYRNADAFVIVSGEYNHGLQPALKNLLDHFLEEYFFRPSAIVSYSAGSFAGVRASVHLQAVLCELGMPSISRSFPVSKAGTAFDEDGNVLTPGADRRFDRFASELEWYAEALKRQRDEKGVPQLIGPVPAVRTRGTDHAFESSFLLRPAAARAPLRSSRPSSCRLQSPRTRCRLRAVHELQCVHAHNRC
jgi:hypothetical protein